MGCLWAPRRSALQMRPDGGNHIRRRRHGHSPLFFQTFTRGFLGSAEIDDPRIGWHRIVFDTNRLQSKG